MAASPLSRPRALVLLAALTVAALALRSWGISERGLTFDEIDNATMSAHSPAEILRFHAAVVLNAPGHYLLQHLLLPLGRSERSLRLSSVLLGTAAVPATYALGAAVFGPSEGVLAAALVAFSPLLATHSQTARMYALFHLLVLFSFLGFLGIVRRGGPRDAALYAVATALAFHVHYLTAYVVAGEIVFFLLLAALGGRGGLPDVRGRWRVAAGAACAAAALCLPWAVAAGMFRRRPILWPIWIEHHPLRAFVETLRAFAASSAGQEWHTRAAWSVVWAQSLLAVPLFFSILLARRRAEAGARFSLLFLASVLGTVIAGLAALRVNFEPRHAAFVLPLWALVTARGIAGFARSVFPARPARALAAGLAFCLVAAAPALAALLSATTLNYEGWREAARHLQTAVTPDEGIVLLDMAGPSVSFYIEGSSLAGRARPVSSLDQVRDECSRRRGTWFVSLDPTFYPPLLPALGWLLEHADRVDTIAAGSTNRLIVGRVPGPCEPPTASERDPSYWMDFEIPCAPAHRLQLLYFLAVVPGGPIDLDAIPRADRELPGEWDETKLSRLVEIVAAEAG